MSSTASSVNATPTRDRLPFPQSSNPSPNTPHRTPATSSSVSSLPSSSSVPPSQPSSTLESLLAANANAPSPPLAALEQAVSERNILSSQNTQLWKLIEKQRSGYNQILKELERVRTERDSYKHRLHSAGHVNGDASSRKHKDVERERGLKHSSSSPATATTSESGHSDTPSKPGMVRHQSDDQRELSVFAPSLSPSIIANYFFIL